MKTNLTIVLVGLGLTANAEMWPEFRGPGGDGVSQAENVPIEIGEEKNLVWKTDLPGRGWSSPVFDGDSLWVTTAEEIFPDEGERLKILKESGEKERTFSQRQVATHIDLAVVEIDFESGEIQQTIDLGSIENPQTIHALNSFASPTPVLSSDGSNLFAHFGAFGTFAIETASGNIAWQRVIDLEHGVGPGSSPILFENLLVLICDGIDRQFVTTLDADTGETVWTTDRPEMRAPLGDQKKSYNTPVVLTDRDGRKQLICMGAQWLVSYEPASGEEIWRLDHGSGFSVVPRPVYSEKHGLLYLSTGFGKPELLAIRVDGSGDITDSDKIAWREEKRIPAKPSPLLVGDELFVISDGGIGTCFDAATGKIHWTERIDGNYSASPLFADGHIYVGNQEGTLSVLKPGPSFEVVATSQLDGSIMASPIAMNNALVIRSDKALYRFGN